MEIITGEQNNYQERVNSALAVLSTVL